MGAKAGIEASVSREIQGSSSVDDSVGLSLARSISDMGLLLSAMEKVSLVDHVLVDLIVCHEACGRRP